VRSNLELYRSIWIKDGEGETYLSDHISAVGFGIAHIPPFSLPLQRAWIQCHWVHLHLCFRRSQLLWRVSKYNCCYKILSLSRSPVPLMQSLHFLKHGRHVTAQAVGIREEPQRLRGRPGNNYLGRGLTRPPGSRYVLKTVAEARLLPHSVFNYLVMVKHTLWALLLSRCYHTASCIRYATAPSSFHPF